MNTSPRSALRGVTLIEVLVVVSILAAIMALLFPAVQAAREAGRRALCFNNLRQIGIGLHTYHDLHKYLPVSIGPWGDGIPTRERNGKGWIVGILPDLEASSIYDKLALGFNGDFFNGSGFYDARIRDAVQMVPSTLYCPSDGSSRRSSLTQPEYLGIPVGVTNYQGVAGDMQLGGLRSIHIGSFPDNHNLSSCNGLFFRLSYQNPQRFGKVLDGLTQTFMVGEGIPLHNSRSMAFFANGDWASCHAQPNFKPRPPTPDIWENVQSFRSKHFGGVSFVMADGSVQFVNESIDHSNYRARATRAGHEVQQINE